MAQPAARRHLDPGHAVDEIGAVPEPDMSLDDMRFTARPDVAAEEAARVTAAFVSVDDSAEVGRAVLKAEACDHLLPGIQDGWELVEAAALEEGLIW